MITMRHRELSSSFEPTQEEWKNKSLELKQVQAFLTDERYQTPQGGLNALAIKQLMKWQRSCTTNITRCCDVA